MATISKVKIANMALSNLGTRSTIESFTENSIEAQQVDLWYDFARIAALEAFDWSFARKRILLAVHSDDPPEGVWGFRYQYPSDAVSIRWLTNPVGKTGDAVPFEVESSIDGSTKTILTDLAEACAVYTWDLEDTGLYTAFFVRTLAYSLAHDMAMALTGKLSVKENMAGNFQRLILTAPAHNANERVGPAPRDADWVRFRQTGIIGQENDWLALPDASN